jgi:AcrR family transcriptional regulator
LILPGALALTYLSPYSEMARPTSISNQQILDAARAVFLANGFARASTVAIARRAGVSEGSIFNRFATKDDLFRAAMDEAQPPAFALDGYVGQGDLRKNLIRITIESVHYLSNLLPKLMLRWSERELSPKANACSPPREILRALTAFFKAEMALGRVGGEPNIIARMFMGSVWNYCFLQTVAGDRSLSAKTFAERLIAGLWQGIAPARNNR